MNRRLAYAHFWIVASESASIMEKCLHAPYKLGDTRPQLEHARRKLRGSFSLWADAATRQRYFDVVTPLDHAYGALTHAMESHFIDRDGVQVALAMCKQALEIVSEKGGYRDVA